MRSRSISRINDKIVVRSWLVVVSLFAIVSSPAAAQTATSAKKTPEKAAMQRWTAAWNRHDSTTIRAMLGDSTILEGGDDRVLVGRDKVMTWVQEWLPGTRALTVTPLYTGAGDRGLYEFGRWRLDLTAGDPSLTGVHHFVFRRDGAGAWQVVSMYIYSDSEPARLQHPSR